MARIKIGDIIQNNWADAQSSYRYGIICNIDANFFEVLTVQRDGTLLLFCCCRHDDYSIVGHIDIVDVIKHGLKQIQEGGAE